MSSPRGLDEGGMVGITPYDPSVVGDFARRGPNGGESERVRARGVIGSGEEGCDVSLGVCDPKSGPSPILAAMRERRDGSGCVRTLRYMLNDRRALFAWGTYLLA